MSEILLNRLEIRLFRLGFAESILALASVCGPNWSSWGDQTIEEFRDYAAALKRHEKVPRQSTIFVDRFAAYFQEARLLPQHYEQLAREIFSDIPKCGCLDWHACRKSCPKGKVA